MESKNNQMAPTGGYLKGVASAMQKQMPPIEHFDSLTKENFWNDLQAKCPKQMLIFCEWIDQYKKRINWNNYRKYIESDNLIEIKYHDLPIEMQFGIFLRFTRDQSVPHFFMPTQWNNIPQAIRDWFGFGESMINARKV